MAKAQYELPDHNRFGWLPYREPQSRSYGKCGCGCGEDVLPGYEGYKWDDMYFSERSCVFTHLKTLGLEEVG